MMFKGYEELKDMNKNELINRFKDEIYPDRKRGGISYVKKKLRNDAISTGYMQESVGTDMSQYRPTIGEDEYTWGELERYPADMVRIFLYQHLTKTKGFGEEE